MTIATDSTAAATPPATPEITEDSTAETSAETVEDQALIWLPVERAVVHLKGMGLPHSRATIYRNYGRDELEGVTHFGVPVSADQPTLGERDVVDSEVVDDCESHVMMVEQPSTPTHDLATSLAADQSRLLRMLESQERVIESQARTIEKQQERLSLTRPEQPPSLQPAVTPPTPVQIRGSAKRWYQFWR